MGRPYTHFTVDMSSADGHPDPMRKPARTTVTRAKQLQEAKRRQRARQRAAGMVHVQLTVPRSVADRITVARRSGVFDQTLQQVLERSVIRIADYPQLAELAWNRTDALMSAGEAFQLYERNWRFLRGVELQSHERALIDRLVKELGGGLLNA